MLQRELAVSEVSLELFGSVAPGKRVTLELRKKAFQAEVSWFSLIWKNRSVELAGNG